MGESTWYQERSNISNHDMKLSCLSIVGEYIIPWRRSFGVLPIGPPQQLQCCTSMSRGPVLRDGSQVMHCEESHVTDIELEIQLRSADMMCSYPANASTLRDAYDGWVLPGDPCLALCSVCQGRTRRSRQSGACIVATCNTIKATKVRL